jgi:hypothetical protein
MIMKRTTLLLAGLAALAAAPGLAGEGSGALHELAGDMAGVKAQLDAEHHGARVQVAQKDIADKLDQVIKKLQEPPPPGHPDCPVPRDGDRPPGPPAADPGTADGKPQPRRSASPAQREALTTGDIVKSKPGTADGSASGREWWRLSARRRAELDLAASEQLPARYRRLLEMYYLSIAEEEK